MADGIAKNLERVIEGWQALGKAWRKRWNDLGEAIDDKDWLDVGHHLGAGFLSDLIQEPYRTWLYLILIAIAVYAGSYTGLYQWPLGWRGWTPS